jgi:hypothetical protein
LPDLFFNNFLKGKINCVLVFSSLNYSNQQRGLKGQIVVGEDNMNFKIKSALIFKFWMGCLLINLCIACAGGNPLGRGGWVEEDSRIPILDGGPHQGTWQTRDVSINYEYQEATSSLQIAGVIELASYIQNNFNTLEHLRLNIHFLEANGIVLETKRIRAFGYRRFFDSLGEMSFNSRFNLTQDTVAFAFSYHGRVTEGGGSGNFSRSGDRIDWEFWKVPRRSPPQ